MDFLKDWNAFVQKLSNIFGSYLPEDDDKDAIMSIPFSPDGKCKGITYREPLIILSMSSKGELK